MKPKNIPQIPEIILEKLSDSEHYTHFLCVEFVNLVERFVALHNAADVHHRVTFLMTTELRGFVYGVRCLLGNHSLHHAFCVVLDELFCLENSAVVATSPPDSAVLENAVIETAQGASYFLLPIQHGLTNHLIDYQSVPKTVFNPVLVEYVPVNQLLHYENDLPYHSLESVINVMRERGLLKTEMVGG